MFFRKSICFLSSVSALVALFMILLSPQLASAAGWQCSFTTNCYASQSDCNTQCAAVHSGSCVISTCTPSSQPPTQPPNPPPDGGVRPGTNPDGGVRPGSGNSLSLPNPLGTASTIPELLARIMNFLIVIATPIAGIMVLWSAYQILTAAGDEEKFTKGKKTLLYVVIGYALVIISSGVVSIVSGVLRGDTLGSPGTSEDVGPTTGQIGDSCVGDPGCAPGLFCNFSAGVPGRCSTIPLGGSGGLGTSCTTAADCLFPFQCLLSSGPGSPTVCRNP